jgi:hypothetical protein
MRRVWQQALVAAAVALVLALMPSMAGAAGQTYTVVQCHPLNRAHANAILEDAPPYAARSFCGDPQNDYAMKVTSTRGSRHGGYGRVRWTTGSPALGIVSVDLKAKLRRDNRNTARLWMADPHLNEVTRVATGGSGPTAYRHYGWDAARQGPRQFVASLSCERTDGCKQSDLAKTWVRDIRFKVADYMAPSFTTIDGTLLSGGWLRGGQSIHAQATDLGSGLKTLAVTVDGSRDPSAQVRLRLGRCEGHLARRIDDHVFRRLVDAFAQRIADEAGDGEQESCDEWGLGEPEREAEGAEQRQTGRVAERHLGARREGQRDAQLHGRLPKSGVGIQ